MSSATQTQAADARGSRLQGELDRYLELLTRDDPPERIILFGSLATGRLSEWSDLDLIVIRETSQPFLERIKTILSLLKPQVGVDLLVYTPQEFEQLCRERCFFRDEVLAKGKVVYERGHS